MTVEITRGDIAALPSSDRAAELLPLTDGDTLTLSCTTILPEGRLPRPARHHGLRL